MSGAGARTIAVGTGRPVATVHSDGDTMVRWITRRGAWEDLGVRTSEDPAALDVVRRLKVY